MSNTPTAHDLLAAITTERDREEQELLIRHVLEQRGEITLSGGDFETLSSRFGARAPTNTGCQNEPKRPVWFETFLRNVCEIPDRNSPEGGPEAIVATLEELRNCALSAIEEHAGAPDARECLMDVVSHHRDFVSACDYRRHLDISKGDTDSASYWQHQIDVLTRMKAQAERALGTTVTAAFPDQEREDLVALLRAIRPDYTAVGSRDVDTTAQRERIDRAISILTGRAGYTEGKQRKRYLDNVQNPLGYVPLRDRLKGAATTLAEGGHHAEEKTAYDAIDQLDELDFSSDVLDRLAKLLDGVATALKGETRPLQAHSWHDLPELARDAMASTHNAPFMIVAMDDDHKAHVHYCANEEEVADVIGTYLYTKGPESDDEHENVRANVESLLEDGFIHFEGDPSIYLYRPASVQGAAAENAELHPDTAKLVRRFARSLANKLLMAQRKYSYSNNWLTNDNFDELRSELKSHVAKGDPRDVAAYCAFLWHHNEPTAVETQD